MATTRLHSYFLRKDADIVLAFAHAESEKIRRNYSLERPLHQIKILRCLQRRTVTCALAVGLTLALRASHAQIFKAQGLHPRTIEQVLGVHNHRVADNAADAVKVERAEFRPACAEHQRIRAFSHGIC